MIAFVQPFSLGGKAGGARILRTLVEDAPQEWVSICTVVGDTPELADGEVWIPGRPLVRSIDRLVRLQRVLSSNLDIVFGGRLERRLVEFCTSKGVTAIHAIPHGLDFWYAFKAARKMGIKYYLNVHDELYYNLRGTAYLPYAMKRLRQVWQEADGVFVISDAMGEEYNRRYGVRDYAVVTDGLAKIASGPVKRDANSIRVYMMGSAHMSYRANFDALLDGLELIQNRHPEMEVSLTMRGGFPYPKRDTVKLVELPWGTQADVEADLKDVDILYMPLPFEEKFASLALYSLATKLVTYLGTGLPIVYHGPSYSAAAKLLTKAKAAVLIEENTAEAVATNLLGVGDRSNEVVTNALTLARDRFMIDDQREILWSALGRK